MKAKVNGKTPKEETLETSKIDAIKNIIFGENISSYNKEFETIKNDIANKKEELLDLISETRKELETAIDTLGSDINIRITELDDKLEEKVGTLNDTLVNKKSLSDLFIKLGNKLND
ncbi:fructose 1,6-bisphosphatase [uncultured Winogradskyella sp.]|uniref:fructose 1,6-bisphosphatase n=1 Tax=uncultured Winogradskyella sp. TaxID=395353 RepID=UPI002638016E|nr:fructose 1,6-bisphosphatase [uncultured Winogradskyella sp.]